MYKSITEYVNETNEVMNDVSKQVLKVISSCGFKFNESLSDKVKFPAIIHRGRIDIMYLNCSRSTKWYTIKISCPYGDPMFTINFVNNGTVNGMKVMTELMSDIKFTNNLMSELSRIDLTKLTVVER